MLTRLSIRNFKRFRDVDIELGNPVVFVGPNNSGKTTALQALTLWRAGLVRWFEKREGSTAPEKRPGVAVNRRDLIAVPVPAANLLWRDLHTHETAPVGDKRQTRPVRIEIGVDGIDGGQPWHCGLEFNYANEESIYCRPARAEGQASDAERPPLPEHAAGVRLAHLPPMSGLAAIEDRLDPGAIQVRLGEGRTAEVLRNLCYQLYTHTDAWSRVSDRIHDLFGVRLHPPRYVAARGQVTMTYSDERRTDLDISSAGRGLHQTLLLLSHMSVNQGAVLLLDEPDAHLEFLRQRQVYQTLSEMARLTGSQVIAASHSEVVLNEAADRDMVVAFLGKPHRIDDRGSQLLKSLKEIGYDQYLQAEQTGWVLYVEGATDLAILRALARALGHPASVLLERPFMRPVQNLPQRARDHFYGLREAKTDLVGFALFDRLDKKLSTEGALVERMWRRREIENYIGTPPILLRWALAEGTRQAGALFATQWANAMRETIDEFETAFKTIGKRTPWNPDGKITDEFLDPLFRQFFAKLRLPNLLDKTDYHVLAEHLCADEIDPEVGEVLDQIVETASKARAAPAE